ncbi:tectonin domain-containing protein [Dactylosporangium sp. AC04546]|uniref:tectonin domain-containing protein n=1 Tax=Dactylosporangium sp. AC04546 TaxID=2862460 RepID=UPI001EDD55D2|nr:tectonin domain-containing protein [Dactylosporangium sp. AC04546]WVK86992.1 tectonin domain-containing protein [Dactylosporangium sp. AC04546]
MTLTRFAMAALTAVTILVAPAAPAGAGPAVAGAGLAVAANGDGRLELFAVNGQVRHRWQQPGGWSAWAPLDGTLQSVAAETNADGRMELFGVNAEGQVWHRWQQTGGWSTWAPLDGTMSALAAARNGDGRLELFGVNPDGQIWHRWQQPGGWSSWAPLDGTLRSVAAETNADGRIELFGVNAEGQVWHRWQQPGGWSPWAAFDGTLSTVAVARNGDGRLELFGVNPDGQIWHRWQQTGGWSAWAPLDGTLGTVAAETNADGRIELFGVNAEGQVWHRWQQAGGWSAWAELAGGLKPPSLASPSTWQVVQRVSYSNTPWTEEAQGVTTDGTNWYVGSNSEDGRRLYKFGPGFPRGDARVLGVLALPSNAGDHLGPPVWDPVRRRIVVAVEPSNVWVVEPAAMQTEFLGPLGGDGRKPQGTSIPWVAVNPVDGLLYSSAFGREDQPVTSVDVVHVYNPDDGYRWVRSVQLSRPIQQVQGGHIAADGQLYLTSNATFDISAYNLADGAYGGSRVVELNPDDDDEIEGLTLGRYEWDATTGSDVAVLVLDNDLLNEDDVALVFYRADPAT